MDDQVKKAIADLNTAFAEFKRLNDERWAQVQARGQADPLLSASVDKANAEITRLSNEIKNLQAKLLEAENERSRFAAAATPEQRALEMQHATKFFNFLRGQDAESVTDPDLTSYRNFKKAQNVYFRKGLQAFGMPEIRDALSTGAAPSGGIWVTPDVSGRIVELVYQTSPMRALASIQAIGTDTLQGFNDLDEAASGWVGETDSRPETGTPAAQGMWSIPMQEQYANPKITQKMMDDTQFPVEAWLAKKVAQKMARTENTAFVSGNGILKPRGFNNYTPGATAPTKTNWAGVIEQVKTGVNNDFAATNKADIFLDVIAKLKVELRQGASFVMNQVTLAATRKIKDGQGNYLFFPQFFGGPGTAAPQGTSALGTGSDAVGSTISAAGSIFGFPVFELADLPDYTASTPRAVWFANWAEAYQIIDHTVGIRVLRDPYTGKPYVSFYTTKRVGGDVINFEALKAIQFAA